MTRLAVLHPSGLLGGELREALEGRGELWRELRLLTTRDDEAGTLTEVAGAAAMVTMLEPGDLERLDVAFFCGGIEESRPLIEALAPASTAIVLSPDAAPGDGRPVVAGVNLETACRGETILSPHPGAVFLAHLLHPLAEFGPRRPTATLLQPVSTHSRAALDELFEQTRGILRFEPDLPRTIFAAQLAFNVIPDQASSEHLVAHLEAVLGGGVEAAVQVVQAGVFHGYGASLHVELAADPGLGPVREALAAHPANELAVDPEHLGVIDAAGRGEVLVGAVEPEPAGGYWIWAVMDNLTCGGAGNAMKILETVLGPLVH